MASPETIASGGTGNTGALSADTVFHVEEGTVHLTTDSGTTYIPFHAGEKVVFGSGVTVGWLNKNATSARLNYMAITS